MSTYSKKQLQDILTQHSLWLEDSTKGERAYLGGADLSEADLRGANLSEADLSEADLGGAYLNGANLGYIKGVCIYSFSGPRNFAYMANGNITIGCETLTIAHWLDNYKAIGEKAEYTQEEIEVYGNWIRLMGTI